MSLTDPSHPGLSVRDSMEAMGWTVTGCAVRLGVSRNTMSRLINGRCGISPAMALALERIGWSNAEFWMRRQAHYDLCPRTPPLRGSLTYISTAARRRSSEHRQRIVPALVLPSRRHRNYLESPPGHPYLPGAPQPRP